MPVLKIGLSTLLGDSVVEAKYVLRTLTRLAGCAVDFAWVPEGDKRAIDWDLYYGPAGSAPGLRCRVRVDALPGLAQMWAAESEPQTFSEQNGLPFISFEAARSGLARLSNESVHFHNDIVRSCFWLLTGTRERSYSKDRHGSATLTGSFLDRHGMLARPLVSQYAAFLRAFFTRSGLAPRALPWTGTTSGAFVFSHDVDYPQMIRWIEAIRLTGTQGVRGLRRVGGVLSGANNFWKFADWIEFERALGARAAFFFSARRGSLWQYATGTPDCFYDVRSAEFRTLFHQLRDEGCEIGLHTSYNAYQSTDVMAAERDVLREVSGAAIHGNRHHYFRLNPPAPHETLAKHEALGFTYDSSLAYAYYAGFRRGVCHPFHVFHPVERRELGILQIPVAWMDDHFDRRLTINRITDPENFAAGLLDVVRQTHGVAVVDYHVRGMNSDFFPKYGPWLRRFAEKHLDSTLSYLTPDVVAEQYGRYERDLDALSRDQTAQPPVSLGNGTHARAVAAAAPSAVGAATVGLLQESEYAKWDAFVEAHPHATIYHTIAWKRISEESLGHKGVHLRALNAGGDIVGVLPLFQVDALGGRVLVSVPLRDKGGPLAINPDVAQQLITAAADLTRTRRAKRAAIKFPVAGLESAFAAAGFTEEKHWVTTVVPVAMGEEKLWNEVFRSPTRRAVNKARNSGLVPRWSDREADLDRFYDVFLMTRRKLGVPAYPRSFFRAIWRHLSPRGLVRLLLVERDGVTHGALLVFPYKREVVSAYMGSNPESKDARINDLLFWEAIRWSAESGFESYYFGADSPLQEGLLAYKRKWGGDQFTIPNYFYSPNGSVHQTADSSSQKYAMTRKAISLAPVPIYRAFSAWATRKLW
ncbi:MAG: GNAT family N-acetyltransferase [Gemmatimonadota bacterium]